MKEKCCYLNSFDTISLGFREIAGFHFWSGFQRKEDDALPTEKSKKKKKPKKEKKSKEKG